MTLTKQYKFAKSLFLMMNHFFVLILPKIEQANIDLKYIAQYKVKDVEITRGASESASHSVYDAKFGYKGCPVSI